MDISQITIGQQLTWLHVARGGYGWGTPVNAEVVKVGKSRVQVRVKKVSGELVIRSVKPESLRERKVAR